MLKAHQACIDLEKGVLRIRGEEVKFLSEHELPDKARDPKEEDIDTTSGGASSSSSNAPVAPPARSSFPGGGHTLGQAPARAPGAAARNAPARASSSHPEDKIRVLMDLGASRELAISTLDAAGGNVDVAASLLF